ncbi:MAG: hypothetical protein AAFY88_31320, partial [Acidobacteriota bacterium]
MTNYVYDQIGGRGWPPQEYCIWSGFPYDRSLRPLISHADLEALLVPGYINALPEFDAWGHAF